MLDILSKLKSFYIAAGCSVAGLIFRLPLWTTLGNSVPYMTFFPAVILSAWQGGLGSGLLCTAFSVIASTYFLIEPIQSFAIRTAADALGLILFSGVGAFISWVTDAQRKARVMAEKRLHLLEQESAERKKAEQSLRLANQRLWSINRELEEFTYLAHHDLQEPLRMITLYTQFLLRRLDKRDGVIEECAGFISSGVDRMQRLVSDTLAYSRILHDEQPQYGTADLNAAFQQASNALASKIRDTNARITACTLPTVIANEGEIAVVFENLIENAIKFGKKDEPPHIAISASPHGAEWIVAVKDNGIGFAPEYSERIFGLFKRLHRQDEIPGTGLGLALCKRIVERFGGKMWAEGELGAGTVVYFSLRTDAPADQPELRLNGDSREQSQLGAVP